MYRGVTTVLLALAVLFYQYVSVSYVLSQLTRFLAINRYFRIQYTLLQLNYTLSDIASFQILAQNR